MGGITPEKIGPEARLPRIETRDVSLHAIPSATVDRAAELVRVAHNRCANLAAEGEAPSITYAQAIADRREALRLLRDTPAADFAGWETKRDILGELEVWIGREDPECCDFAIQLVHEMSGLVELYQTGAAREANRSRNGSWGGPGRWLIGAASSVPAFLMERFGPG